MRYVWVSALNEYSELHPSVSWYSLNVSSCDSLTGAAETVCH